MVAQRHDWSTALCITASDTALSVAPHSNATTRGDCRTELRSVVGRRAGTFVGTLSLHALSPVSSLVDPLTGEQIPAKAFLDAERNLLKSQGWIYDPLTRAYHPPGN